MNEHAKLTFADLKIGDKFIGFPVPGDNSGHGGYLRGSYLFEKKDSKTAVRLIDGATSSYTEYSEKTDVIKVV